MTTLLTLLWVLLLGLLIGGLVTSRLESKSRLLKSIKPTKPRTERDEIFDLLLLQLTRPGDWEVLEHELRHASGIKLWEHVGYASDGSPYFGRGWNGPKIEWAGEQQRAIIQARDSVKHWHKLRSGEPLTAEENYWHHLANWSTDDPMIQDLKAVMCLNLPKD